MQANGYPPVPARAGGLRNAWGITAAPLRERLDALARELLGKRAWAVRAIVFDKTPDSNWAVPWHQDLSIPLRERHEVDGYRAWSRKEGVWHAQPPRAVLEAMLTLRLHLDDCGADNAPLQVLPGSHAHGVLDAAHGAAWAAAGEPVTCIARAGDVLAMRPLLLHSSSKAAQPARRRVLHVEYAAIELPPPLQWRAA